MSDTGAAAAAASTTQNTSDSAANGASGAAANTPWYQGADEETVGYFQNRGWDKKTAAEAAIEAGKAHRNAEKLIGGPADSLLRIPKDASDADGWNKVYERLGRPAKADAYDFKGVKYSDGTVLADAYTDFLKETAFKLNLPVDKAQEWAQAQISHFEKVEQAEIATKQATKQAELAALKKSWGAHFDANNYGATQAAEKLGLNQEMLNAMADQLGPGKVMQAMLGVWQKISESPYIAGAPGSSPGVVSREGAVAKLVELRQDAGWRKRYFDGDRAAAAEFDSLTAIATGQPG